MDEINAFDFDKAWKYKKPNKGEEATKVKTKKSVNRHLYKRIASELALEEELDWHFEKGCSYHCISFGDIDSLSYLRFIVKQQKLKYVAISTWVMASADIEEMEKWFDKGLVKKMDFYVGEIFQGSYSAEFKKLKDLQKKTGGRVAIFRNHSKVMVGFGERFDFVIESSANVNTNPRCEQTCITIDDGLALFYKGFFDEIKAFNKEDCKGWKPFEL
jgi:hypothetical protein